MLDHTQTENAAIGGVNDWIAKAWPLVRSELYVAPVCVNNAAVLPLHGPAWVVGDFPETVSAPSVLEVSARILDVSNV